MEDVLTSSKLALAQKNMQAYFSTHDVQYVAPGAVFIHMGTGQRSEGRMAIGEMLHYIYHVAFDAKGEITNSLVTEDKAMIEGFFTGTHIGEFAGIPATHKKVNVPLCVTYDLKDGLIHEARIYMLGDVMMQQLQST
jgi:predicted ester cyclase